METYINKRGIETKIYTETLESEAREQIYKLAESEAYCNNTIRIMPDAHAGKGCVIGTTVQLTDRICPNTVGVDISCGVSIYGLGKAIPDLKEFDDIIHKYIPSGRSVHDVGFYIMDLNALKCSSALGKDAIEYAYHSLGTLGGGNHFIEVDKDDEGYYYLVIHTGSRNLGLQICNHYQNIAIKNANPNAALIKRTIERFKKEHRETEIEAAIKSIDHRVIDGDLAYIKGADMEDYLYDMKIIAEFAHDNRNIIAHDICRNLYIEYFRITETLHNYIDTDTNILRKGAVRANKGEFLAIPLNMRDGTLLCIGKGNEDWNCSAPHGAGRLMSRKRAKEILSLEDYRSEMKDVVTTSVSEKTLDEAPEAYKSAEEIKKLISPTVEIKKILKPIYNFKAEE